MATNYYELLSFLSSVKPASLYYNSKEGSVKKVVAENYGEIYNTGSPKILFVCEYITDKGYEGNLLVWKKFPGAVEYQIFKKNVFKDKAYFEEIKLADLPFCEEEKLKYADYLVSIGMSGLNFGDIYVFLDSHIKEDRIYEYSLKARRYPTTIDEVSYVDAVVNSKKMLTKTVVDSKSPLRVLSEQVGVPSWQVVLLNEKMKYFGYPAIRPAIYFYEGKQFDLNYPADSSVVLDYYKNNFAKFGLDAFKGTIRMLGGLPESVQSAAIYNTVDKSNNFYYKSFLNNIKQLTGPFYSNLDSLSQTSTEEWTKGTTVFSLLLSELGISLLPAIPREYDNLLTNDGLSRIFSFINSVYLTSENQSSIDLKYKIANFVVNGQTQLAESFRNIVKSTNMSFFTVLQQIVASGATET